MCIILVGIIYRMLHSHIFTHTHKPQYWPWCDLTDASDTPSVHISHLKFEIKKAKTGLLRPYEKNHFSKTALFWGSIINWLTGMLTALTF